MSDVISMFPFRDFKPLSYESTTIAEAIRQIVNLAHIQVVICEEDDEDNDMTPQERIRSFALSARKMVKLTEVLQQLNEAKP